MKKLLLFIALSLVVIAPSVISCNNSSDKAQTIQGTCPEHGPFENTVKCINPYHEPHVVDLDTIPCPQ